MSYALPMPPLPDVVLHAYHEAGHAIMALLCGQEVECVSLDGDEQCEHPHTLIIVGAERRARAMHPARAAILRCLAGRHGAALAGADDPSAGTVDDRRQAERIIAEFGEELPRETMASLDREAGLLIRRYRVHVERLAKALVHRRRLDGQEVTDAAGPIVPPSPFGLSIVRR
jgi:hypothetical protein